MKWRIQYNPNAEAYKIQFKSWWWLPYWTDGAEKYSTLAEAQEVATAAFDKPKDEWLTVYPPPPRREVRPFGIY